MPIGVFVALAETVANTVSTTVVSANGVKVTKYQTEAERIRSQANIKIVGYVLAIVVIVSSVFIFIFKKRR